MSEQNENCGTCRFWDLHTEEEPRAGTCHRHAPAPHPFTVSSWIQTTGFAAQQRGWSEVGETVWPMTLEHHWCGDWRDWQKP